MMARWRWRDVGCVGAHHHRCKSFRSPSRCMTFERYVATSFLPLIARRAAMSKSNDERSLVIGGTKSHAPESITGSLLCLYETYEWRMIPNCTGRYTCKSHDVAAHLTPLELLERAGVDCTTLKEYEFSLTDKDDKVRVVSLDSQNSYGVISYVKKSSEDDRFVHTLNAPSGFRRKLQAVGIQVTDSDITHPGR